MTTLDFTDPDLLDTTADEAAMEWQDAFAVSPSDELRESLRQYSEWKTHRRRQPFSHADFVLAKQQEAKAGETLRDWEVLDNDAGFDHVARRRGFHDRYERAAAVIPREELRPKIARELFVQDVTGATEEQLRTGVPQMQVAKQVLGIDDPSDEAFDAAMHGYIRTQAAKRDRRKKMQDLGARMAVTKLSAEDAWSATKAKLTEEGLSEEDMEDSARTLYFARERLRQDFGDVIPLARRVFATVAQGEGTDAAGHRAFDSLDEAANAFAMLPEDDFPKMIFALHALAEEHGADVEGFFRKVGTSFDRGMESYGVSLSTFFKGRQSTELRNMLERGEAIFVPVEEGATPREAALNVFGNLARGQGIREAGLGADRGKERRPLNEMERMMVGQFADHLGRLQTAKQALNDYKGVVSRVQSDNLLAQGVYDATASLPYMAAGFAGPVGLMMNGAVYAEDNFRQLKASHPDVDDGTLRNVADAAAVPMAAIERFQARTLMGKFPGADRFLSRLAGGGFLKRLAVTQAAEFTQEMVQDSMLPIARELAERISDDAGLEGSLREELRELAGESPRIFFATLPLSVLGAGGTTIADRFRRNHLDALMADEKGMRALAFTDDDIQSVRDAGSTEEKVARFQEIFRTKTPEQRREAAEAVMQPPEEGTSMPVIRPRSAGGFEVSFPDGTVESVSTEEEALTAHTAWVEQHFENARQVSERAIAGEDVEAVFDEELARFGEARPGVEVREEEASTLGDLRRRGLLTIQQAWQRVKDYSAQTGASLEGFTPSDFDRFRVQGSADASARFADGVLEGAITLAKGEKDVATLWEEQAETYMHAQLGDGGTWTDAELLAELRKVEKQTGKTFLAGESREHLVEGFSHAARNYAAGNFSDLNFGEKLKHLLNLLAEKIAAAFTLSQDLRKLSADGELSPALESAIRESLGFDGNQEAEMERLRTDADARMSAEIAEAMLGPGRTFSVAPIAKYDALQREIPTEGQVSAIKLRTGHLLTFPQNHILFMERHGIRPEDVQSGGWVIDGQYEPSERSDTMRWVRARLAGRTFSITPIGPGQREITEAPAVVEIAEDPFDDFASEKKSEWLARWKRWEAENRSTWRRTVDLPEGKVAITGTTAHEVRQAKRLESLPHHFQAAANLAQLLENSRLSIVEVPDGKPNVAEVHKRYAWADFPDGQRRHVMMTVLRWKSDVDADTAYSLEALEVQENAPDAIQGVEPSTPGAEIAIAGDTGTLAHFLSGIKPEHRTFSVSRDGDSLFSLATLISVKSGGITARAAVWRGMARAVRDVRQRAEKRIPAGMDAEALERSLAELDLREESDLTASREKLAEDLRALEARRDNARAEHTQNLDRLDLEEKDALQDEGERLLAKWGEKITMRRRIGAEAKKTVAARFRGLRDKEKARHRTALAKLEAREKTLRREAKRREEDISRRGKAREGDLTAQADEFTRRQARFEQLQDIATLEAIARSLPAAIRGRLTNAFRKLSEMPTPAERETYLSSLLPKIEQALENHLQKLFRAAIRKELAKGEAKLSEARTRGGKIGAAGHAIFDQAKAAMPLEADAASFRAEVLQQILENGGIANPSAEMKAAMDGWTTALNTRLAEGETLTEDLIGELDGRIAALELFGDYESADSARLEEALELLQGVYTDGRRQWLETLKARRDLRDARVAKLREGLRMNRRIEDIDRSKRVRADESKLRRLGEGLMGAMIGGSQTFRRLAELSHDPEVTKLVEQMEWDFAAAEMVQQDRDLADAEAVSQALRSILGAHTRHGLAKRLHQLSSNDKGTLVPVTKIEGRKEVTVSVPVKFAEAIVNGEAAGFDTPSGQRVELSEAQIRKLAEEFEKFSELPDKERNRRRSIPVTTVEAAGDRKSIGPVSQLEALQLYLTMRQPDQAAKLEGLGYDAATLAELETFLDPQVKALGAWMVDYLEADQLAIDNLHRLEKGIGLRLVPSYFPVRNDVALSTTGEIALDGGGIQHTGRSASFTRQRVANTAPPDHINALAVFLAHRQQVNFWLSHVTALREWGGVIRDERLSGAIKARMGSAFHDAIQRSLRRIEAGGSLRSNSLLWIERVVKQFIRNFALGILGGRVSTLVANSSAIANITYEVPFDELTAGMRDVIANPSAFKDAWQSPAIQRRLKGGSTFEAQLAKSRGPTAKPLAALADAAAMPGMEAINYVDTGANTVAAAFIWERTRRQSLDDGLNEEQARAAADRKVEVVLMRAAQPTLRFARSEFELMMLESPLSLPFALFISERRKNTAITFMAVRELLTGKGTYGRKMAAQQALAGLILMPALVTALGSAWAALAKGKDDEEESWWARYKDRMTDPKAWAYALSTEHLRSAPVLGEGAAAATAGAIDSKGVEWIIENTLPAGFAERWEESEVRYFDSNPNPLVRAGRQTFRTGDIFAEGATAEERVDAAIDSAQAFGTLIPGAAVAAQAANLGESALGVFNTAGGSLSEADRIKLLKARFSRFSRDLDDTLGPSTLPDGKPDKAVRRAKRDAKADRLASILAPMSNEQRTAFLEALSTSQASQEVRKRARRLLRNQTPSTP